jgi:HK97 family phage major capsid protein
MKNIQALREKIANLAKQANHILAEKGDQTWSVEDQQKFDNLADEIERAKSQIRAEEKMRDLDADKFFNELTNGGSTPGQRA